MLKNDNRRVPLFFDQSKNEKNIHKTLYCITLFCLSFIFIGCSQSSKFHQPKFFQGKISASKPQGEYNERDYRVDKHTKAQIGHASYYASCMSGRKTASGEVCSLDHYTAAHRTLPFGTMLRVTMLQNNKSVIVRINDRGPYGRGRIVDLSLAAAKKIGLVRPGIAKVKIEKLEILQ